MCLPGRGQEQHPSSRSIPSPTHHWLSSPLLLPGGPPRPVPRGSRPLERLVPLQAPCHGQLPGSRGKEASRGTQKPALPARDRYHPEQRQCPPPLDRAAVPGMASGPAPVHFGNRPALGRRGSSSLAGGVGTGAVSVTVISLFAGLGFPPRNPPPQGAGVRLPKLLFPAPSSSGWRGRRGMVGFFLYFFTLGQLPGRMEAGDIHPAVFNSSPSGFAHPHPLVPSSVQGCPRRGRVWAWKHHLPIIFFVPI